MYAVKANIPIFRGIILYDLGNYKAFIYGAWQDIPTFDSVDYLISRRLFRRMYNHLEK